MQSTSKSSLNKSKSSNASTRNVRIHPKNVSEVNDHYRPSHKQLTLPPHPPPFLLSPHPSLCYSIFASLCLSHLSPTTNPFTLCQEVIWIQWVCAVDPLFLRRGGLEKCIVLSQQKSQRGKSVRASHSFQRIARMKVKVLSFGWHCSFSVWYIFHKTKWNWLIYLSQGIEQQHGARGPIFMG